MDVDVDVGAVEVKNKQIIGRLDNDPLNDYEGRVERKSRVGCHSRG
jgi:hypothetical protein